MQGCGWFVEKEKSEETRLKMVKFSIIMATNKKDENLLPIFFTGYQDAEVIIISKTCDKSGKELLNTQKGKYKQIIYAPCEKVYSYNLDISQSRNTGILYAEGKYVILVDDSIELKADFWLKLDEDVRKYSDLGFIFQKLHGDLNYPKWFNMYELNKVPRYSKITDPNFTLSFGAVPLKTLLSVNGYDIRYDQGYWFEDEDLLARCLRYGQNFILDTELMGYKFKHNSPGPKQPFYVNKWLYETTLPEILNGKYFAYNPYNLREERMNKLKEKEDWVI